MLATDSLPAPTQNTVLLFSEHPEYGGRRCRRQKNAKNLIQVCLDLESLSSSSLHLRARNQHEIRSLLRLGPVILLSAVVRSDNVWAVGQLELRCVSRRDCASQLLQFLHTEVRQPLIALQAVLGASRVPSRFVCYTRVKWAHAVHASTTIRNGLPLQAAMFFSTTVRV